MHIRRAPQARACETSTIIQHPSSNPSSHSLNHPSTSFSLPLPGPGIEPRHHSSNHRIIGSSNPSPWRLQALRISILLSIGRSNRLPQPATGCHSPPQVIKMIAPRSPSETPRRHPSRQDRAFRPSITSGNHPGASNAFGSGFESSNHRLIQPSRIE